MRSLRLARSQSYFNCTSCLMRTTSTVALRSGRQVSSPSISQRLFPVVKTSLKVSSGGALVVAAFALGATEADCEAVSADSEETVADECLEDELWKDPLREGSARFLAYFRRLKILLASSTRHDRLARPYFYDTASACLQIYRLLERYRRVGEAYSPFELG